MKFLRFLILAVLAIVIIGSLALAALPFLTSTEIVRGAAERRISATLGMPVSLAGSADITVFPRPVASFDNVRIGAEGENGRFPIVVESLEAPISWRTFFGQETSFTAFVFRGPVAMLPRDMLRFGTETDNEFTAELDALLSRLPSSPGAIRIENGSVFFTDGDAVPSDGLFGLNGQLNWPRRDGRITLSGDARWRGKPVSLSLDLASVGDFIHDTPSDLQITIASDETNLRFDGQASGGPRYYAEGAVEFDTQSGRAFADWLGLSTLRGASAGQLAIEGDIHLAGTRLRLSEAAFYFGQSKATGTFDFTRDTEAGIPRLSGTFAFDELDVSDALSPFIALPRASNLNPRLDTSFIKDMQADIRISAETGRFVGLPLTKLAATAQVGNSVAVFDIGDAELLGGNLQARLTFDQQKPDNHTASMMVSAQGIDTTVLSDASIWPAMVPQGKTDLMIEMAAKEGSWQNMRETATGDFRAKVTGGSSILASLDNLEFGSDTQFATLSTDALALKPLESAEVDMRISEGILTCRTCAYTSSGKTSDLLGVVSHISGSTALTLMPRLSGDAPQPGDQSAMRFFIGGSIARPFVTRVPARSTQPETAQ